MKRIGSFSRKLYVDTTDKYISGKRKSPSSVDSGKKIEQIFAWKTNMHKSNINKPE